MSANSEVESSELDELINQARERGCWTLPVLMHYKTTQKSRQLAIGTTTDSSKCCVKSNGLTLSMRLKSWVNGLFAWPSGVVTGRKRNSN
jgi:hypothetical protein